MDTAKHNSTTLPRTFNYTSKRTIDVLQDVLGTPLYFYDHGEAVQARFKEATMLLNKDNYFLFKELI